ncbi:zona pellucida sperm-binding protein 3-like [Cololabis saira]|uniref:zona pellucida sperm-binding protein 3-like n=1 Tax=Cololabis saira TaxID=129043 RepID=UPI002AD4AE5B|nr:zona pellucida sperm-binding protein 3-like [Cololabis saira]
MFAGRSASLTVLALLALGITDAMRTLKEGPMIDAEGREYKVVLLPESQPQLSHRPTVRVECTERSMIVFIQADLFRNGRLVSPGDLFLGDAQYSKAERCQAVLSGEHEYVIEAGLQDCGSNLSISGDDVIYSNKLIFRPTFSHHAITRMTHAVVPVSCHYKRTHTVSSNAQHQAITFSKSAKFSTGNSPFSLKLMGGDWSTELFFNSFRLGDLLRLEASYTGPDPRWLFMDSCVATLTPDMTSVPRYYFIENNGCFTDSRGGGSNALFRPRLRTESLQLQLDAFLFHNDLRNTVFVTCQLKAAPQTWQSSPSNKACNYVQSSWRSVDGYDAACQCCDDVCPRSPPTDEVLCDTVTIGPMVILPSD